MATVRELYALKNDRPEQLTIFIGYEVDKVKLTATPVKAVQRDKFSMISLSSGKIMAIGTDYFFDPIDCINLMVKSRRGQIQAIEDEIKEIEQFRQRVIAAKQKEKDAK